MSIFADRINRRSLAHPKMGERDRPEQRGGLQRPLVCHLKKMESHWFRVLVVCQRSHGVASCNIAIRGAAPCSRQGCQGGISGPANVLCRAANLRMARATKADHRWLAHGHIRRGRQSVLCSPAFRQDNGRFPFYPIAQASANHRSSHRSSTERFIGQAHWCSPRSPI